MSPPPVEGEAGQPELGVPAPPTESTDAPQPESSSKAFDRLELELQSQDPETRRQAAVELGQLGDKRASILLVHLLREDSDTGVRAGAAMALGVLGGPGAQGALAAVANGDSSEEVRQAARAALVKLGGTSPDEPPPVPAEDRQPIRHEAQARQIRTRAPTPAYATTPEYISGYRMRSAGIMVTAIGGGVGLLGSLLGGLSSLACSNMNEDGWSDERDCTVPNAILIAGGATLVTSLAVGLPVLLVGKKRMQRATQGRTALIPTVGFSISEERKAFSATWRF